MRIVHVNDHLDWIGGIETYLLSTISRLSNSGIEQAAIFGKGDPSHLSRAIQIPEVSSPRPSDRSSTRSKVESAIVEFGADVAHVHNLYNIGAIEACLNSVPTVLYVHDFRYLCPASSFYYRRPNVICERTCSSLCFPLGLIKRCLTPRFPLNMWYYQRVEWMRQNAHRFAAITAISCYVKDRLIQSGFPAEKIHVLPYFCPLEPVSAPPAPPAKHVVLYMGRMAKYKGFDQFIEVLSRLPNDVEGLMIGNLSDSIVKEINELAGGLGCNDRLRLRSWASRDEIRGIMSKMTVVTFPSTCPETLGLVGMEALSSGVPVVGYRVGGTGEWLRDGETGFSVDVKDTTAFADRVETLIRSPNLRQRLGGNGITLIREKFSPETHLRQLIHIYEMAVQQSAPAKPTNLQGELV